MFSLLSNFNYNDGNGGVGGGDGNDDDGDYDDGGGGNEDGGGGCVVNDYGGSVSSISICTTLIYSILTSSNTDAKALPVIGVDVLRRCRVSLFIAIFKNFLFLDYDSYSRPF